MIFKGVGPGGMKLTGWERARALTHAYNTLALYTAGKAMGVDLTRNIKGS